MKSIIITLSLAGVAVLAPAVDAGCDSGGIGTGTMTSYTNVCSNGNMHTEDCSFLTKATDCWGEFRQENIGCTPYTNPHTDFYKANCDYSDQESCCATSVGDCCEIDPLPLVGFIIGVLFGTSILCFCCLCKKGEPLVGYNKKDQTSCFGWAGCLAGGLMWEGVEKREKRLKEAAKFKSSDDYCFECKYQVCLARSKAPSTKAWPIVLLIAAIRVSSEAVDMYAMGVTFGQFQLCPHIEECDLIVTDESKYTGKGECEVKLGCADFCQQTGNGACCDAGTSGDCCLQGVTNKRIAACKACSEGEFSESAINLGAERPTACGRYNGDLEKGKHEPKKTTRGIQIVIILAMIPGAVSLLGWAFFLANVCCFNGLNFFEDWRTYRTGPCAMISFLSMDLLSSLIFITLISEGYTSSTVKAGLVGGAIGSLLDLIEIVSSCGCCGCGTAENAWE